MQLSDAVAGVSLLFSQKEKKKFILSVENGCERPCFIIIYGPSTVTECNWVMFVGVDILLVCNSVRL